jgi:adenine phosphoribosyltransferase
MENYRMDPRIEGLKSQIRDIPDFPKPGILFRDITPLLADPQAFGAAVDLLTEHSRSLSLDAILAIESRGFIFGGALAIALGVPLHIIRKPGKLPWKTDTVEYSLEYGTDRLQMHQNSLRPGARVLVLDDLLATGGTASAAIQLAAKQGGHVVECAFMIELLFLQGRERLAPTPTFSLIQY